MERQVQGRQAEERPVGCATAPQGEAPGLGPDQDRHAPAGLLAEALMQAQTSERGYLEHLPAGLWFIDGTGQIVYGNLRIGEKIEDPPCVLTLAEPKPAALRAALLRAHGAATEAQ